MTVTRIVSPPLSPVHPLDDVAGAIRFLCQKNGITPSEPAADLALLHDTEWSDKAAVLQQEALRQSVESLRAAARPPQHAATAAALPAPAGGTTAAGRGRNE